MPTKQSIFTTRHNAAFVELGAIAPNQLWSAFDVHRQAAKQGQAKLFVTTIWNYHTLTNDQFENRAILRNVGDGSLWYRIEKPTSGTKRLTWTAQWNGMKIALAQDVPIVGVLKDAHTKRCSLSHLFDCGSPMYERATGAMWLQLRPRGEIGCETAEGDIYNIVNAPIDTVDQLNGTFVDAVLAALKLTSEERKRLASQMPKLPKKISVSTTAFVRNQYVAAEVLSRAQGFCKACGGAAPFLKRSNKTPYLEVHHIKHLAKGGEDTVSNAIAVCPNCHRQYHHG